MIEISGKVISGDKFGRTLGFPTVNLDRRQYVRQKMKIKLGVWAGTARILNSKLKVLNYPAGIVIGPIDNKGLPKIEAHLIGFKGNIYGKKVTITLKKFIRTFRKFNSVKALKQQIAKDIAVVKKT